MSDQDTPQQPESQPDAPGTPPGQQGGTQGSGEGERTYTKAEMAAIVEDRLRRDREARERQTAKERETAEAAQLAEQQKFKELADKHAARVAELEPYQAKAERYEAALTALLTEERKQVPEHLYPLLDRMDPADQLEYIAGHRDKFALPPATNGHTTGVPATPRASGVTPAQIIETTKQELRQSGRYAL